MKEDSTNVIGMQEGRSRRIQALLAVFTVLATGLLVYFFLFYGRLSLGPEQPIPFSHRVHVNDKRISCFLCHPEAMTSARAGVPPLRTCMLCHTRIAVTYPPIRDLRERYFANKPVLWNRVFMLPEFVYFDHSMHIHRRIDCSVCHGNVPAMDRIVLPSIQNLQMGFCVGCHRKSKVSYDCFLCHR